MQTGKQPHYMRFFGKIPAILCACKSRQIKEKMKKIMANVLKILLVYWYTFQWDVIYGLQTKHDWLAGFLLFTAEYLHRACNCTTPLLLCSRHVLLFCDDRVKTNDWKFRKQKTHYLTTENSLFNGFVSVQSCFILSMFMHFSVILYLL